MEKFKKNIKIVPKCEEKLYKYINGNNIGSDE